MASGSSSTLFSEKINRNRILELTSESSQTFNDDISIISIKNKTLEETVKLLNYLRLEDLPNIFIVSIKLKNDAIVLFKIIENIKILKSRPILLELNSNLYLRKKNEETFINLNLNLSEEEIQRNNNNSKFSTETFLNIQNRLKFSDELYNEKIENIYLEAIRSCDDICIRLLNLLHVVKNFNKIVQFIIQSKNFEIFLAFLDTFDAKNVKNEKVEEILKLKCDENSQSPFLIAVESRNLEVVKFLLSYAQKLPNLINLTLLKEATDLSVRKEYFEIFDQIEKVVTSIVSKGREILTKIDKLHGEIEAGNLANVKEFTENFKTYRLCYGSQKVCALEHAIDCKQFKIFAYLRAKNFYTDKGTELEEKIKLLSTNEQNEIRIQNLNYVNEHPDAFIGILLSKCKFDALSPISADDVKEMLNELSQNVNLKPFLQIAAQADLKIIFDFANESVKNMVPGYDDGTMGLAFFGQGELYVGRDREKFLRYGTFMHELTHMVLYLIYENACLPYCKGDKVREELWDQILKNQRENFENNREIVEAIIQWVFLFYDEGYQQRAELAVRPNHIIARYLDNPEKVQELRQDHDELFSFIENNILRDLRVPNVFRLITLNKNFEVITKIESSTLQLETSNTYEIINQRTKKLLVTSNVPKLLFAKLYQEIENSSHNKLDLKVENIFVDVERFDQLFFKSELESLLESSSCVQRVIFDLNGAKNVEKIIKYLKDYDTKAKLIVICEENLFDELKFDKISIQFEAKNLTVESRRKLLRKEIKFQGKKFIAFNIFKEISIEIFPSLRLDGKISVNTNENFSSIENFIPRVIERESNLVTMDKLITIRDQILVISGIAGSGKTTLLRKITEKLLEQYPTHWISFLSLRNFIEELSKMSENCFQESLAKILNLSPIERGIFKQKFLKGEAKILFDGFDEISPECKAETLDLFKLFKAQDKNQIWITARDYLEHDLKSELEVKSFKIQKLTKNDQIEFLCNYWKDSHHDKNFIQTCAEQLSDKISKIIKDFPSIIGIPIIIQSVAKLFADKINENFSSEIERLRLFDIYKMIIEECLKNLNRNCPTSLLTNRLSPIQVHEYFAVVYFFGKNFAKDLNLIYDSTEWPLEEVSRYGILTYQKNGEVSFNHLTYGEHLLANFVNSMFRHYEKFSESQLDMLMKILGQQRFKITLIFLEESLLNVENKKLKIFQLKNATKIFEIDVNWVQFPNLLKTLVKSFLNDFYKNSKIFQEYLLNEVKYDIFQMILESMDNEVLKDFFLYQNEDKKTVLHLALERSFRLDCLLTNMKQKLSKEVQKLIIKKEDKNGENVLMATSFQNQWVSKLLRNHVETIMTKEEMVEFLSEVEKYTLWKYGARLVSSEKDDGEKRFKFF